MLKPIRTKNIIHANATLVFAVCTLLATAVTSRADDKEHAGGKDRPESSSSSVSKDSSAQGGAGTASSSQAGSASGKLSRTDEKFIKDAAMGGMMEVQMGKLGLKNGQSQAVKTYAQRLIDDHTKANAELKQLAAQKGVTLPDDHFASTSTSSGSGTESESARTRVRGAEGEEHREHEAHARNLKKLESLSGTEFDREFARMAVKDHEKDVKEFEKAGQKADDTDVKAFAQKTAPVLREHLQQARSLTSQVGSSTGSSTGSSQ